MWPAILCAVGILAGFALVLRVPKCGAQTSDVATEFSIIIPARNEGKNLPHLLNSIVRSRVRPVEIVLVDDGSADNTAAIADSFGARVVPSAPLPEGWTGKTWACYQGAKLARTDLLLFLDADVSFLADGLGKIITAWAREGNKRIALSVLPYHDIAAGYEQLSLIFNLLMAAGAGGFGVFSSQSLFGQSLLISKELYFEVGGHQSVKDAVLENLRLAQILRVKGTRIMPLSGSGTLRMRMFPEGSQQMTESWSKAFVQGARDSSRLVVVCSVFWISALWSCLFLIVIDAGPGRAASAIVYLLLALQLYLISRQLGRYRLVTCLFYPIPLAYYCFVFGRSMVNLAAGRKAVWKGRNV
jgi:4,4'-diaponeurosporenoate glycosyltransferase